MNFFLTNWILMQKLGFWKQICSTCEFSSKIRQLNFRQINLPLRGFWRVNDALVKFRFSMFNIELMVSKMKVMPGFPPNSVRSSFNELNPPIHECWRTSEWRLMKTFTEINFLCVQKIKTKLMVLRNFNVIPGFRSKSPLELPP